VDLSWSGRASEATEEASAEEEREEVSVCLAEELTCRHDEKHAVREGAGWPPELLRWMETGREAVPDGSAPASPSCPRAPILGALVALSPAAAARSAH